LNINVLYNLYIVAPLLIIVSFSDTLLGRIAKSHYEKYTSTVFMYESAISRKGRRSIREDIAASISKIMVIIFLMAILKMGQISGLPELMAGYRLGLGFTIAIFLIIDLRHIESILIARLLIRRKQDIEGKLLIKTGYSLRQSAIQLMTLFIILAGVTAITADIFFLGAMFAPLALIIRNLALIRS